MTHQFFEQRKRILIRNFIIVPNYPLQHADQLVHEYFILFQSKELSQELIAIDFSKLDFIPPTRRKNFLDGLH
jgi:hypothetical protein